MTVSIEALRDFIRGLNYGESEWVAEMPVRETFQGEVVWEGTVHVFNLVEYRFADQCFAWAHSVDDSQNVKFYAVLKSLTIDSPIEAVRAAIVAEHDK